VGASSGHAAFATWVGLAFELAGDGAVGAVVAEEEQQRVVANAEFSEFGVETTNHFVHESRHVGEVFGAFVEVLADGRWVPVGAVWSGLKRIVGEDHRVVKEERAVLFSGDEIEREVVDELGAVTALRILFFHALLFQARVGVTGWAAGLLPEQGFVKAEVLGGIRFFAELPFAADSGGVTGLFEEVRKGGLAAEQGAEVEVVVEVVATRHELHPGGRAERLRMAVFKAQTVRCEPVEMRGLVRLAAIGGDAFVAKVIGHDEYDIGRSLSRQRGDNTEAKAEAGEEGEGRIHERSDCGRNESVRVLLRACMKSDIMHPDKISNLTVMSNIQESLFKLIDEFIGNGGNLVSSAIIPLKDVELTEIQESLKLQFNEPTRALVRWTGGDWSAFDEHPSHRVNFIPDFFVLNPENIVYYEKKYRKSDNLGHVTLPGSLRGNEIAAIVPVLSSGVDFISLLPKGDSCGLILRRNDHSVASEYWPSIDSFLDFTREAWQKGIYRINEMEEFVDIDTDRLASIIPASVVYFGGGGY